MKDATRLCPDMPVPVLSVIRQTENAGMAYNVYNNIKQKYFSCDIHTNEDWESVTKTRYMHDNTNHMFIRVDSPNHLDAYIANKDTIMQYDIIAISDYNKGFISTETIERICSYHPLVFIDTKKDLNTWVNNAAFIKINNYEYNNSLNYINSNTILQDKIIRTKGPGGCFFRQKQYPVMPAEVKDSSGAGDSFFAALVVKYAQIENIYESIQYANICASEVVKHRGVTLI